jgi:nucleotide-binding universal stress UspA family protein
MVPDIKKILFPTNLSQSSRRAFEYAVSIASRYGATITLLHVMEEVSRSSDVRLRDLLGEERWRELQESREQEARQILIGKKKEGAMIRECLDEFCEKIRTDLGETGFTTEEIVVARGNVVDEILSEARSRDCDLIIMGYHLRGKLEEAVLGSTTRRLLRRSNIPVMLVQLGEEEAQE